LASVVGLRDSCGNVPLQLCVPRHCYVSVPQSITCEELIVLSYVDGSTTLKGIAEASGLELKEAIEIFLHLLTQGLVEVAED
jgi:hypothetical protein